MLGLFSDLTVTVCHCGRLKQTLTPPPPAPPPFEVRSPGASHQTSSVGLAPAPASIVPPTLKTNGLEPGKSTCARPSVISSPDPSSPDEMHTLIPSNATACRRSLICVRAELVQSGESS